MYSIFPHPHIYKKKNKKNLKYQHYSWSRLDQHRSGRARSASAKLDQATLANTSKNVSIFYWPVQHCPLLLYYWGNGISTSVFFINESIRCDKLILAFSLLRNKINHYLSKRLTYVLYIYVTGKATLEFTKDLNIKISLLLLLIN